MNCSDFDIELDLFRKKGRVDKFGPKTREHLDSCMGCWKKMVAARWHLARNTDELNELKDFLGKGFKFGCDASWQLADDWGAKERDSDELILDFYKKTQWYIYSLILWSACGQRPSYAQIGLEILRNYSIKKIVDFGAGVGTDTFEFAAYDYQVIAFEINRYCNQFLKWKNKKLNAGVVILNDDSRFNEDFDLLWSMDVIEHLKDPVSTLKPFLKRCKMFIYDTEFSGVSGGRHPFHFQHNENELCDEWLNLGFVEIKRANLHNKFNIFARN
ncbi:MAG: glycosyl transferase family protein [uncultured bacterium]|nr:MAG: glycosyl transferase family protein [uncultured bacterium]